MTGKSVPHATHGHRGHVPTSAAKITKESAVNHKEIDTNGVNRMLLRRPWRYDQKNRFLDKVWTPQLSTTPPKPFLLSFSTHLGDQTLARSIWKRKSQFSNWPKDYLSRSGRREDSEDVRSWWWQKPITTNTKPEQPKRLVWNPFLWGKQNPTEGVVCRRQPQSVSPYNYKPVCSVVRCSESRTAHLSSIRKK